MNQRRGADSVERFVFLFFNYNMFLLRVSGIGIFKVASKGVKGRLGINFFYRFCQYLIICIEEENIAFRLVFIDPELGLKILAKIIIVPIQMIGGYVGDDAYVGGKIHNIIQLETADF